MRRLALSFSLAFVVCATAAPVPKAVKAKRPDAEVFMGAWELVEGNNGGQKYTWRFDDDLTMWSKAVGANGPGAKWVIRLDPDKSPKEIDLNSDGTCYRGIYEIEGDEIRLVYGGQRPANFDDKPRTNYTVLRRVKGEGK